MVEKELHNDEVEEEVDYGGSTDSTTQIVVEEELHNDKEEETDYPTGSDDSTAFADRMDLADAYDDGNDTGGGMEDTIGTT